MKKTTVYDKIKGHLETMPKARERKNKNMFIAFLLDNKHDIRDGEPLTAEAIESIVGDALTYDRAWRQVLQKEPKLRGGDYGEKEELELKELEKLGYIPKHVDNQTPKTKADQDFDDLVADAVAKF